MRVNRTKMNIFTLIFFLRMDLHLFVFSLVKNCFSSHIFHLQTLFRNKKNVFFYELILCSVLSWMYCSTVFETNWQREKVIEEEVAQSHPSNEDYPVLFKLLLYWNLFPLLILCVLFQEKPLQLYIPLLQSLFPKHYYYFMKRSVSVSWTLLYQESTRNY